MKRQIELQIEELIKKNRKLFSENAELSAKVEEKDGLIAGLNEKIAVLSEQVSSEKLIIESLMTVKDGSGADTVYSDSAAIGEIKADEKPCAAAPERTDISGFETDPDISKASSFIGKAVRECAAVCNEFVESGGNNTKDLINLALGRTEVFKSEILLILSSDKSSEEKSCEAQELLKTVTDYFDLLRSQI